MLEGAEQPSVTEGQILAGKYRVERVLGEGGMGIVVAAQHLYLPQRVAIKFMRAQAAHDAGAVERFLREARAQVALSSEHVARVLDVGQLDSGVPYMVMEHLEGLDLAQWLVRHGPMPAIDAVGAVLQACEAIAEAHAMGIIHRDLKPGNLFLAQRRDGTSIIKVLDFGIAKVVDLNAAASAGLTGTGLALGSPAYMSPEQIRSTKGVDARTDIWALGCILYELVGGVRPFAGETLGELVAQIVSESPRHLRDRQPDVHEGLAAAIGQCLERRVERRIQDVAELAAKVVPYGPREASTSLERIRRWRAGPPDRAQPPGEGSKGAPSIPSAAPATQTASPWLRSSKMAGAGSRRRMVVVAGGIATALLATIAVVAHEHGPPRAVHADSVLAPLPSSTASVHAMVGAVAPVGTVAATSPDPLESAPAISVESLPAAAAAPTPPPENHPAAKPDAGPATGSRSPRPISKPAPARPSSTSSSSNEQDLF